MLHLSLENIRLIDAIARTGSLSAAAETLHKVPSTISYTVNKLEKQMGLTFFERHGPKVKLTKIGRALLEEGRDLLFAANDLELRLRRLAEGVETELVIMIDETLNTSVYSKYLLDFERSAICTQIYFRRVVFLTAWDALLARRADLIIASGDGPSGGGYRSLLLGEMNFDFCVAPDHPLAYEEKPLKVEQLSKYPAIILSDSGRKEPLRTSLLRFGTNLIVVDQMADKIRLLKEGVGYGFLPHYNALPSVENGHLVVLPVEESRKNERFYLAWRAGDDGRALSWWREQLCKPLTKSDFMSGE
ncbi:MAG: LysR family transcriptional regulator [Burkholderiales bacterium]|jgi:DNA-binding transcriptional LysR family regulator|nr:LysR family transcriptional regulator [Burkholderiales bacterium]